MSTKLFDITKQLDKFLSSTANSELLKETSGISRDSIIEAHIQKRRLDTDKGGMTVFAGTSKDHKVNCLNIVSVSVAERNRRKGLFTDFLELLEGFDYGSYFDKCSDFYVRIDKVMNPVLDEFLLKKGYIQTKAENDLHFSYHKIVWNIKAAWKRFEERPTAYQYSVGLCSG
jgi:hypothetical protein